MADQVLTAWSGARAMEDMILQFMTGRAGSLWGVSASLDAESNEPVVIVRAKGLDRIYCFDLPEAARCVTAFRKCEAENREHPAARELGRLGGMMEAAIADIMLPDSEEPV